MSDSGTSFHLNLTESHLSLLLEDKLYIQRSVDYMSSPDMAAFTIGRVSIGELSEGRPVTEAALCARLKRVVESGVVDPSTGVSAQMAQGALQYLLTQRGKGGGAKPGRLEGLSAVARALPT